MGLIRVRARGLIRSGWRATVALAVVAGLAGGVAMAITAAGRRTATAYDRFAVFADVPELLLNFCPAGLDPTVPGAIEECYRYDAADEVRVLNALPEVEQAARGSFRAVTIAHPDAPSDTTLASALALVDPGFPSSPAGRYRVVDGRDATGLHEIAVNEVLADRARVGIGDEVLVTFWGPDELGRFGTDGDTFSGPELEARVVGITRSLTDLAASEAGIGASTTGVASIPLEMARATRAAGFAGVLVEAVDDDSSAAQAAIDAAFPDRIFNIAPAVGDDEVEPTREAIRYEAQATTAVGLVTGLLAATFVGQAVARQSRREWDDGPTLRALGMTTGEAAGSASARGVVIGLPAAVLAVCIAIVLSPRGPVGIGRRAEIDPGVHLDLPVLLVGAIVVVAVGALASAAPLIGGRALRSVVPAVAPERPRRSFGLPPAAAAGLHLARDRRRAGIELATAVGSAGAAVILVVAAVTVTTSLDDLLATPARFGAPWDISIGLDMQRGAPEIGATLEGPRLRDAVDELAVITGSDLEIGGEVAWVHSFAPLGSTHRVPPLPIGEGRPPATAREIALGSLTMDAAGVDIGDTVEVSNISSGESFEMTVVGTATINDNFEASPGRGGVATLEFIAEAAPEVLDEGGPVILTLTPGTDPEAVAAELRERVGTAVERPLPQTAVRNVDRIRGLPYTMAAIVGLLAAASMVHALVLAVGRHRRVLGVLKGIGFTRGQVGRAVAWHATTYAVVALVIALPLGVVAGRSGWRLVAESLGVPVVPVVPVLGPVVVVVGLLTLANVAAAYPAWRAARLSTAAVLRAE